jgi:phage-related protein
MADWIWGHGYGIRDTEQPVIISHKFNDGYEQRFGDGINNIRQVWRVPLSNRPLATVMAARTFLRSKGGVTAFTFDNPYGETIKVICRKWEPEFPDYTAANMDLIFEQVFEP